MIYAVAIAGFIMGFLFGQLLLSHMLRGYNRQQIIDLMKDKGARFKYGMTNWGMAVLWTIAFVKIYRVYFF
jgi:hypothetical protein